MRIGQKLLITLLLIVAIPVALVSLLSFEKAKNVINNEVEKEISLVAEFSEEEVLFFFDGLRATTEIFSSDGFVSDSVFEITNDTEDFDKISRDFIDHVVLEKKSGEQSIVFTDILNLDGIIILSTIPERIGIDKSKKEYFIKGKEGTYVADMHMEHMEDGDILEMEVSTPVRFHSHTVTSYVHPEDDVIGVLVNHFDSKDLNSLLKGEDALSLGAKTQERGIGETAEVYLVNQDKLMITDSLFVENAAFRQKIDTYPVQKCFDDDEEVTGAWTDYRGISVKGASMCIDFGNFKWVLLSEINEKEFLAPITSLQNSVAFVASITFLIVMFVVISFTKSIVNPIKGLINGATKIGEGDLDYLIEIESKDEIGQLAETFNQMTKNLKGHSKEIQAKNEELKKSKVKIESALKQSEESKEELEKMNESMVGRELKMIELKKELTHLKGKDSRQINK
jgi:HAMP domain-containing protein